MTTTNGNTFKIMFWVMAGICFTGLTMLTTGVVANDKRYIDKIEKNDAKNTEQHSIIIKEMIARDEKLLESLHKFDVRQEVLIKAVDRIERKL